MRLNSNPSFYMPENIFNNCGEWGYVCHFPSVMSCCIESLNSHLLAFSNLRIFQFQSHPEYSISSFQKPKEQLTNSELSSTLI